MASVAPHTEQQSDIEAHPIIFFDGVCGLCNASIDFVMARDGQQIFRYTHLQGQTAAQLLTPEQCADLDTFYVRVNGRTLERSQAWLYIMKRLGGVWGLLRVFAIVPRFILDGVYNLIARFRYRVFGKKDACRLPTPQERALFLP